MYQDCGIVFAATGEFYRKLARRAARNVRQVMPDIQIDLFTDRPLDDDVFTRVHMLEQPSKRPKMEALRRSRFARSLYLDVDVVMLAPVWDVFDILKQADFAGAHEQFGSSPVGMTVIRHEIPPAFRQINSGVIGVRKSEKTDLFLAGWQQEFHDLKLMFDQPLLRELLYECDLRVFVLPNEYNQMFPPHLRVSNHLMMAPRLLHLPIIHTKKNYAEPVDAPFDIGLFLKPQVIDRVNDLFQTDRTLGNAPQLRAFAGETLRKVPVFYRIARTINNWYR